MFDPVFWSAALDWCGRNGLETNGARKAAAYTDDGTQWSLVLAGDIDPAQWTRAGSLDKDAVILAALPAAGKRREFSIVGRSPRTFKSALRPALRGKLNGGTSYDAWTDRNRDIAAGIIGGVGAGVAVVLSVVATPAAGALALAATSALTAGVKTGRPVDALEEAADNGTLEALAGESVSPELVNALAGAVEDVPEATPEDAAAPPATEPAPKPSMVQNAALDAALEEFKADPVGYVMAHPAQAIAALGSALALGYLAFRYGIRPR